VAEYNEKAALLRGIVVAELTDEHGNLIARSVSRNLITQIGDQYYAERATGISSPPAQVTGMKLGTGSTAVAKTGAGAALVTYLTDSHQALAATYPQSALNGSSRRITWRAVWAAGKATSASPITEAVLVNETLADSTSLAAATIARVILANIPAKNSAETLTVTWTHDLLGA
jgi:hypothetical protein